MKGRGMKLPFTEPCGNGLLRFNNWDGTQLSTTKGEKKREREPEKRKESKKGVKKKKKSEKGKKPSSLSQSRKNFYNKNFPYLR